MMLFLWPAPSIYFPATDNLPQRLNPISISGPHGFMAIKVSDNEDSFISIQSDPSRQIDQNTKVITISERLSLLWKEFVTLNEMIYRFSSFEIANNQ